MEFRHEVVVRRTEYELRQAEQKAHILEGLLIAIDNLDAVIKLIRASRTPVDAREGLMTNFELSEIQARAILDLRLQKLTGLERDKIKAEYEELMKHINYLKEILGDEGLRMKIIKDEMLEVKEKYGDERKTDITIDDSEIDIEDIIPNEKVVLTISHLGYMKRTQLAEFKEQNRGGKGSKGGGTRDEDFIEEIFVANTHDYIMLFTEKGKCFWLKAYQIPEGSKTSKGRAIQNLISLDKDDKVLAYINVQNLKDEDYINNHYLVFCTKNGIIKKTSLEAYSRPRANGINAITIRENDALIECKLTDGNNEIIVGNNVGKSIRFHESKVRTVGRNSIGVKGMNLTEGKEWAVGMICIAEDKKETSTVLVISENGYGKRTHLNDPETGEAIYRETNRGGKGIKTMNVSVKTGQMVAMKEVEDHFGLMIINKSGLVIRMAVDAISVLGRATQGVRLIRLNEGDAISSVARIKVSEEENEEMKEAENIETEGGENTENPREATEHKTDSEAPISDNDEGGGDEE